MLDETLPTLWQLTTEGLVGAIGLGNNAVDVLLQVQGQADLAVLMLAGHRHAQQPSHFQLRTSGNGMAGTYRANRSRV